MIHKICISIAFVFFFSITLSFLSAQVNKPVHKRLWDTPAWTDTLRNPYAHHAAVAADSGRITYQKICSVCHGTEGKGDGIAAVGLTVPPANHTSDQVQMQSDGSLYYELTNGHAPMPAYKKVLTDKQRWELICYIRTLKAKTATPKAHKS